MKNVVLIGFMGTGKTSTGRMLAAKLGCAFIDMDQKIEEEAGISIPEMFAQKGEAYFREKERQLVTYLAGRRNAVISTGGGTVKDPENMRQFRKTGVVICLTASVDAVLERTSHRGSRPVLDQADQGDRRAAVAGLMKERQELYAHADYMVDTSRLSPMQVTEEILHFLKREGAVRA